MSVQAAPVQAGGLAVLGASALSGSGAAVMRSRASLAATGAEALQLLTVLAFMLMSLGALLISRGRGHTLGDSQFD